jgi:putative membrane protein
MRRFCLTCSLVGPMVLALAVAGVRAAEDEKLDDAAFVKKVSGACLGELKGAEMALQKASDAKVKSFAQRIIDDHAKASKDLEELASRKGWTVSKTVDEKCQRELDKLASVTAQSFDRQYMEGQIKGHEEAIKLFDREAKSGQDADLKEWASKTLPTLKEHLQMAKDASEKKDR